VVALYLNRATNPRDAHEYLLLVCWWHRHKVEGPLALLMALMRLSYPRPLRPDLEREFGQDRTRLCPFIYAIITHIVDNYGSTLR